MLLVYLTFGVVKISAILFYKRLFTELRFRLAANIMMAVVVAWTVAQFIVSPPGSFDGFEHLSVIRSSHSTLGTRLDSGTPNFLTMVLSIFQWPS